MLKIRIRQTVKKKFGKPEGLILIRRLKPPAITVSIIPTAKEINHAGK
jgi:hypothetical protein